MQPFNGISVVIPVGPRPAHKRWLMDCLNSLDGQTLRPYDVLIIDDGAFLDRDDIGGIVSEWHEDRRRYGRHVGECPVDVWRSPCPLGIPAVWNIGIALARSERVVMLASDDWLEPKALESADRAWQKNGHAEGFYWFDVRYSDGEEQSIACNAAMVTKTFWRKSGGFVPEMGVGASDSMLISCLIAHRPKWLIKIGGGPMYNCRRHEESETAARGDWQGIIFAVRDQLTRTWKERE